MKKRTFLHEAVDFIAIGTHALEKDDFTNNFVAAKIFNQYKFIIKCLSVFIRYFMLIPAKLLILVVGFSILSIFMVLFTYLEFKKGVNLIFFLYMKLFALVLAIRARHYGEKTKISEKHVYVSNHTSFLDFIVLSSHKFHHAVISEKHGGVFGFLFKFIISKNGSICFNRSDKKDKNSIKQRITTHTKEGNAPMLVFPEGTCVNNKHTVLFQKGAFEMGVTIVPVALKYKTILADPYWNRRKHGFISHLIYLVSRWRIDVDVYWNAPTKLEKNENPTGFSHRVKKIISKKANLTNTPWNGYFKSQLLCGDLDIYKLAVQNVFTACMNNNLPDLHIHDTKNKQVFLVDYRPLHDPNNTKIFFNTLTYKQFYYECCKEFLRIKALPIKEREVIATSVEYTVGRIFNNKKVIDCDCDQHSK